MSFLKKILSKNNLPVALSVIVVFIFGLQKNYGPDVGFHLQSAKWMIENHKFLSHDVFTYTSFGNNYYDLQWLYQLVIYGLYRLGKDELLVITNAALVAVSILLAWMRCKKEPVRMVRPEVFLFLTIIGTQALMFEVRPHVFSWLFLSVILLVLADHKLGATKKIFVLPLIMLVWVNVHSLSILGLVAIFIYTIGSYFENRKPDKHLVQILALSFLVFLINPYFFEGFLFPFKQFDLLKSHEAKKLYIGELQSPFTLIPLKQQGLNYLITPHFYLHLYSLLVVFAGVKLFRRKQFTKVMLILAFLFILHMAIKNYGYFLVVTLPFVTAYIDEYIEERKKEKKWSGEKLTTRLRWFAVGLSVILTWLCVTDGLKVLRGSPYRFGISVDEQSVPVEATAFLNKNKIYGKILNHLDFGGYLMFNYPEKVFIDGRLELSKPEFFKKYFNSFNPGGLEMLLTEYDPQIIIFPFTKAVGWWSPLIRSKNYRAVYFDGLAAIYLKNGAFENIPAITESTVKTNSNEDIYTRIKEKKPNRAIAVLKSFVQKQYVPLDEQNKATFCFTYGYGEAGLQYSAIGIKKATVNPVDLFYNLSLYFNDVKKYQEAAICSKKAR